VSEYHHYFAAAHFAGGAAQPAPAKQVSRCCVVIPTYNERGTIGILLRRLFDDIAPTIPFELWAVIVDGHSRDGTGDIIRECQAMHNRIVVLTVPRAGLGDAYLKGFQYALREVSPEIIVQMDGDLQHDPDALPRLIAACPPGLGVAIGSRFAAGSLTPGLPVHRRLISKVASWWIHHSLAVPHLTDYTSGYRCIRAGALGNLQHSTAESRGYAFQTRLIVGMLRSGCPVAEVPITFGKRLSGSSKLTAADLLGFVLTIGKLRRNK